MKHSINLDNAIKHIGIPTLDAITSTFPALLPAWLVAKGFYGLAMEYHQDKLNEFVEFIKENPNQFTEEIVKQESFRDGFVYTLEEYLRQRNKQKRKIMQNIFLGFTTNQQKEEFELERFYNCLNILQINEMKALAYVANIHIPLWRESMEKNPMYVGSEYQSIDEYIQGENLMMQIHQNPSDSAPENWKKTLEDLQSLNLIRLKIQNLDTRRLKWIERAGGNLIEYEMYLTQFGLAFCKYISNHSLLEK